MFFLLGLLLFPRMKWNCPSSLVQESPPKITVTAMLLYDWCISYATSTLFFCT